MGGAASFNVSYLPKAVAEFTERYPGIELDIVDGNIPEISAKALNGQIDMFIAPTLKLDDRLSYEELLQEKIFLCVPPQWDINPGVGALADTCGGSPCGKAAAVSCPRWISPVSGTAPSYC